MKDDEQAKKLGDAIDALLRGEEPEMELDDQELIELLRIARLRYRAGKALADAGLAYQELLRRVLQARMVARQMEEKGQEVDDLPPEVDSLGHEDPREFLDPQDPGYGKLVNFLDFQPRTAPTAVAARTSMARKATSTTSRAQPKIRRLLPSRPYRGERSGQKAQALSAVLDGLLSNRKRNVSAGDPDIDQLVQIARLRRFVGQSLAAVGTPYKRRLWTALRMRLIASLRRQSYVAQRPAIATTGGHWSWQRAAAAAAVIALLAAALGPLATTGLANHPAANLFNFIGHHVGVEEVDGPPATQVPTVAPEEPIPIEDAHARLGLPVREPSYLPDGFQLARSSYHPQSITSPEQGMFVVIYTIGGVDPETLTGTKEPRLFIYQEKATSAHDLGVQSGEAEDVLLAGSVPATYAHALWAPGEQGVLEEADADIESLIFDNGPVRVIITYRNGGEVREELFRIAESMLSQ